MNKIWEVRVSTSKTVREFDMELSIIQISTASRISVLSYKMTINKLSIIDGLRCCDYMVALLLWHSLQPQSYWDLKTWPKWVFWVNPSFFIYILCNNYCSSNPFILKFGMSKLFGARNPKIILISKTENKKVLRYSRFQVLSTCDWTGAKKYIWLDR